MITFSDVAFEYESGTKALVGASIEFKPSALTAIVGPNGAGKSTLAKLAMGLLTPTLGSVTIEGHDTRNAPPRLIRSLVGLAWQNPDNQLVCGVVEDDLAFGPENLGLPIKEINRRVSEVMDRLKLQDVRSASIHGLSSAQKQLVAVAGAMAMEPRYLILDEVTARLDRSAAHCMLDAVIAWAADHNVGLIMITHLMSEVLRADSVCRLELLPNGGGRVAMLATPHAVLRDAKLSDEIQLETPLYDTLYHLDQLGVHLSDVPETVSGLVESLCR